MSWTFLAQVFVSLAVFFLLVGFFQRLIGRRDALIALVVGAVLLIGAAIALYQTL